MKAATELEHVLKRATEHGRDQSNDGRVEAMSIWDNILGIINTPPTGNKITTEEFMSKLISENDIGAKSSYFQEKKKKGRWTEIERRMEDR